MLKKALELEPKSKEISAMLRDAIRKSLSSSFERLFGHYINPIFSPGTSENGDKKREDSKGLKLVASDKNLPNDSRQSGSGNSDGSVTRGTPIGFSEAVVEQFVRESLESAINQFAAQGTKTAALASVFVVTVSTFRNSEIDCVYPTFNTGRKFTNGRHRGRFRQSAGILRADERRDSYHS